MGLLLLKTFASLAVLLIVYGLYRLTISVRETCEVAPTIYNMMGFEWKPGEEIGKLIHTSTDPALVAFVDARYAKRPTLYANNSREDFCKNIIWDWTRPLVLAELLDIESECVDLAWLKRNSHIARRLDARDLLRFHFLVVDLRRHYGDAELGLATVLAQEEDADVVQSADASTETVSVPSLSPRTNILLFRKTGRGRWRRSKGSMSAKTRSVLQGAP